ncbi:hypothetical protein G6031_03420 [Dietzia sp. CQ4]|nr:hypothetical protein [Dietzia sp. CQ4]
MYIVGTGSSELHAHMDLDRRIFLHHSGGTVETTILSTTQQNGHWSVVAEVRDRPAGEPK